MESGRVLLGGSEGWSESGVDSGRFFVNGINIGKSLGVLDLGISIVDKWWISRFLLGVLGCG